MERVPGSKNSNSEQNRKQIAWNEQITLLNSIGERDLPIDTKDLIDTLAALNVSGIRTIASNAGHTIEERGTGDTAYPWILISSEDDGKIKIQNLLDTFYSNRPSTGVVRLRVSNNGDDFTLSSLEESLMDKDANNELSEGEKTDLIEKLSVRQQELYEFGDFLKSNYFSN